MSVVDLFLVVLTRKSDFTISIPVKYYVRGTRAAEKKISFFLEKRTTPYECGFFSKKFLRRARPISQVRAVGRRAQSGGCQMT